MESTVARRRDSQEPVRCAPTCGGWPVREPSCPSWFRQLNVQRLLSSVYYPAEDLGLPA